MGGFGRTLPNLAGMPPQFQDPFEQGAEQVARGWHALWDVDPSIGTDPTGWWERKARGASDVMRGASPFLTPAALMGLPAAPLATLAGVGLGTGVGAGTEALAKKAGVPPGQAALVGDIAGGVAGLGTPGVVERETGPTLFHWVSNSLDGAAADALSRIQYRGSLAGTRAAALPVDDLTDMAIWGASKLARGITAFDDWAREMRRDLPPSQYTQLQSNLPKIYKMAQQKYDTHMERVAETFPNTRKLMDLYRKGIAGKDWYDKTYAELQQYFGKDAPMFIDFLASTSVKNTVPGNVTEALKAYMAWKGGVPFEQVQPRFMGTKVNMLNRAIRGQPLTQEGLKVPSFKKNLMGDPLPVTVDRWISRIFGFGESPTEAQYKFMDYLITQTARAKGITPREFQAAIWKAARDAAGMSSSGESFEVILRERLMRDKELRATLERLKTPPSSSQSSPPAKR